MKKVLLPNRDLIQIYLKHVTADDYTIWIPKKFEWIHPNVIVAKNSGDKEVDYLQYDPPGGPCMAIGGHIEIDGDMRTINRIYRELKGAVHVTFEPVISDLECDYTQPEVRNVCDEDRYNLKYKQQKYE